MSVESSDRLQDRDGQRWKKCVHDLPEQILDPLFIAAVMVTRIRFHLLQHFIKDSHGPSIYFGNLFPKIS